MTLDILHRSISYCFYILECKDGKRYYGHTSDLARRLVEHSKGNVKSTKKRRPIKLVYFEEFLSRKDAFRRETQFKNGKTRKETINKLINGFPKAKCQGFNSRKPLTSLSRVRSLKKEVRENDTE